MKVPKFKIGKKLKEGKLPDLQTLPLARLNPMMLISGGVVSLVILTILLFAGGTSRQSNDATLKRA